ncbi:hypothetical protein [Halospeciosus flavus]|uniref:Uncharacterized protein n=1 Tax=Halospeciosus flavus TaxID=3032283 RepID=A0ABD5Z1I3_9EURY|nr:hypothetical protein [Halospeciosus flavus]
MGIVDLHFHESEFTAVKRLGESSGESSEGAESEEEGGPCIGCLLVASLVLAGVATAVGFLVKRKLGGGTTEETTLSEFEGEEESEDVDVA